MIIEEISYCCWKSATVIVLTIFVIRGCALPYDRFDTLKINTTITENLFRMISDIEFSMEDLIAMYQDVTHQRQTVGCSGNCRTPIALWVLQSVSPSPCTSIRKNDCPNGLVCCVLRNNLQKLRHEQFESETNNTIHPWEFESLDLNSTEIGFIQDPIPGDSEEIE